MRERKEREGGRERKSEGESEGGKMGDWECEVP